MKVIKLLVLVVILASLVVSGYLWFNYRDSHPSTSDAYVKADSVTISPQISGKVAQVNVQSFQHVKKGDVLLIIDDSDYQLALKQAEVNISLSKNQIQSASAKAKSTQAQATISQQEKADAEQQNRRMQQLIKKGVVPREQADTAHFKFKEAAAAASAAQAIIQAAQAQVNQTSAQLQAAKLSIAKAQLDLSRTVISAPADGILGEVKVQPGDFIEPSENLFPIINDSSYWVEANFKETDLEKIHMDQPVQIDLDMYPNKVYIGSVETISPASGTAFSLIPAQNATGNWVKVTQRFPVRIKLTETDQKFPFRIGASASVTIDTIPPNQPLGIVSRIISFMNADNSSPQKMSKKKTADNSKDVPSKKVLDSDYQSAINKTEEDSK